MEKEKLVAKAMEIKSKCTDATVEIVGSWIWIKFPAAPAQATRDYVRGLEARWNKKRELWQISDGWRSRGSKYDTDTLKAKYGAQAVTL